LGVAAASADVYAVDAVDAVIAKAMGIDPMNLGWLHYANDLGLGIADLENIDVLGAAIKDIAISFKPHEKNDLQLQ